MPWWTFNTGFEAVRQLAGLQGDASAVQLALKEQTLAANGALPPGAAPAKDDRQVACMLACVHSKFSNDTDTYLHEIKPYWH